MNRNDILFTPLITPDFPNTFSVEKLEQWFSKVYPQPILKEHHPGTRAEVKLKELNKIYPFNACVAKYMHHGWLNNFDIEFSDFVSFLENTYGIEKTDIDILVFLPISEKVDGLGFFHSDLDEAGLRMYIVNEDPESNPLYLIPTKEPYETRPSHIFSAVLEEDDPCLQKKKHIAKLPNDIKGFYVNNVRAVHSPFISKPAKRIAMQILNFSKDNEFKKKTQKLLEDSVEKYKDYVIRWTPENE
jgi:hypothetical protein